MVTAATKTQQYTAADLWRMPSDAPYELWKGELVEVPGTGQESSSAAGRMLRKIGNYVDEHDLGVITGADGNYILFPDRGTVVAPDVGFVRWDSMPGRRMTSTYCPVPPDLAVEVISPSDEPKKMAQKQALYDEARVPIVWWINLKRRVVRVRRPGQPERVLQDGDVLDGEDIIPGFHLPVADIFAQRAT